MYGNSNPQGNPQQQYGNSSYGNSGYGNNQGDTSPMSVGDFVISMLLSIIPLVGLILLFVWAFSSGTNVNKANWAKAQLIFILAVIVLYFALFASILNSLPH